MRLGRWSETRPLQYKAVPITEYILVYRKQTDKLIDWHIRKHPDQQAVADSKIENGYETTNLWKIHPANHPKHPAVFPLELAEKVIKYYSFKKDVVLDPFGGTGTVGKANSDFNLGVPLPSPNHKPTHRQGRAFRYNLFSQYTNANAEKRIFTSIPNAE